MVDAADLKSADESRTGSNPVPSTAYEADPGCSDYFIYKLWLQQYLVSVKS